MSCRSRLNLDLPQGIWSGAYREELCELAEFRIANKGLQIRIRDGRPTGDPVSIEPLSSECSWNPVAPLLHVSERYREPVKAGEDKLLTRTVTSLMPGKI